MNVRYLVTVSRSEQHSDGPDDAEVTFTAPLAVVAEPGFDATVEFMRGRLKVSGPTSGVFAALSSGEADRTLLRLASHP